MSGVIERNDWVRITSTKEAIRASYDGMEYEFLPGAPVDVPRVVARHIFGFGEKDKSTAFARLGWALSSEQQPAALARLNNLKFGIPPPLVEMQQPLPVGHAGADLVPSHQSAGAPIGGDEGEGGDGKPPLTPSTVTLRRGAQITQK